MTITINGERRPVDPGTTVGKLIDGLGQGRAGVAVAVNGEVVPRSTWDHSTVGHGDRLEVLTVAQGG